MTTKDMAKYIEEIAKMPGFRVVQHDGSRVRVHAPDGDMTFLSSNVGSPNSLGNAKAWVKRHGRASDDSSVEDKPTPASVPPKRAAVAVGSPFQPSVPETPAPPAEVIEELQDLLVEDPIPVAASTPTAVVARVVKLPEGHPAIPVPGTQLIDEGDGVVSVKTEVGPELAEQFLKWNIDNRPVTERIVDSYARMMAAGSWVPAACPPLHFADTGKLTDGQKRLLAVVESGTTQRFTLVLGLPESSQDVVDTGQHRLVAHQLKINRFKNPMVLAAAVRTLWLWDHDALISSIPSPSNPELLDYVPLLFGEGYSVEDSASAAVGSGARKFLSQSVIASTHFRMSRADAAAGAEFHEMLSSGAALPVGSPVLALRETMLRRRSLGQKLRQAEQIYLVVRAWQFWREGRDDVSRLQFPRERLTMQHISSIL